MKQLTMKFWGDSTKDNELKPIDKCTIQVSFTIAYLAEHNFTGTWSPAR
jgi:hypothetical protein